MSTPLGNIKGYDLRDRIGAGGFGAVYRAYQTTVGREVAIKIILPGLANQPDFIRRFESEAQLVARLEHPHITPLYDYWRDPEGAYLVMRWLRGGSLRDALEKGPFELRAAAGVIDQIAGALSLAHRSGVIHRDIKPGNILLDEDGNAYLTDFGIAKDLNLNSGGHTQPDAIIGSLDYISPEQARSEPVTPRTDIYSLGVTLYEMITGHHPFQNMSAVERLYKHINDPLPDIITPLEAGVQAAVNRVIHKATAKDPDQRYPDALAFAADFREAVGIGRTSATLEELLTQREQDILRLIIEGRSNKEIAQDLTITLGTVKWYVNQIYSKMGVRSRVQAIVRARELNLIARDGDSDSAIQPVPTEEFQPENPYKGLRAFTAADHKDFFGREKLVEKLLRRMAETGEYSRFLAVVGPSGGGKSSVVKAGLIPAIWRGALPGSEKWFVAEMLPGAQPLDELEIALIKIANQHAGSIREQLERDANGLLRVAQLILPDDGSDLLLAIDQFEETYTLTEDETARQHFLDLLVAAVTAPRSRVRVVITLRADFYDRPLHDPHFGDLLRSRLETILPLSAEELELAIVRPAASVGAAFEPGLVTTIVADVKYQPGALPLLQYALTELFEARQGRLLSREAYQRIGGISGALARRAEELYTSLPPADAAAAQQMFLRLVTLGEGVEDTRRRVPRAELLAVAADPEQMEEVLDTFAAYRLLSFDNDPGTRASTVEVAHEAILREWERLREWLNASRSDIQMQRQMAGMAAEWKAARGDASFLARGSRLEQFEAWMTDTTLALTPDERAFLSASSAERDRQAAVEQERQARETRLERRSQTFLRGLVAVLALAVVIATLLSLTAFSERNQAESARTVAQESADYARSLALASAAQVAELSNNPDQALALAVAANTTISAPPAFAQSILYDTTFAKATRRVFEISGAWSALSPDGSTIAIASFPFTNLITLFDTATGHEIAHFDPDPEIENESVDRGLAWSQDGQSLFYSAFNTADETGRLFQRDVKTLETLRVFEINGSSLLPEGLSVIALSPDGRLLIGGSRTGNLYAWNTEIGVYMRQFSETHLFINSLEFSSDGQTVLATADDSTAVLWDVSSGTPIRKFDDFPAGTSVMRAVFVQQGILALDTNFTQSQETALSLFNAETGELVWRYEFELPLRGGSWMDVGGDSSTALVSFYLVTTPVIFNLESQQITGRLYGHSNAIFQVELSQDGRNVWSTGSDVRLWNLDAPSVVQTLKTDSPNIANLLLSPDGQFLVTVGRNQALTLWEVATGKQVRRFGPSPVAEPNGMYSYLGLVGPTQAGLYDAAFSPDGSLVLSAAVTFPVGEPSDENPPMSHLALWETATGQKHLDFAEAIPGIWPSADFSPDGKQVVAVASRSLDDGIWIFDAQTGQRVHRFGIDNPDTIELEGHRDDVLWVRYSPNGQHILSIGNDGMLLVWDAKTLTIQHALPAPENDFFMQAVFTPDSQRIVSTTGQSGLIVWDVDSGVQQLVMIGHSAFISGLIMSSDGSVAASSSQDGSIMVWDLKTGDALRKLQRTEFSSIPIAFRKDGDALFAAESYTVAEIALWRDGTALLQWARNNRYIRELTCQEQRFYQLQTSCAESAS